MKAKLSDVGITAVRLLEALSASADVLPPLKIAAGCALHIAKLVEDFHSNKKAWAQFAEHVRENVALIAQAIADQRADPRNAIELQENLENLNQVLTRMGADIEQMQRAGTMKRALGFVKDPKRIDDMQKDFERAMQVFHLNSEIHIGQDIGKILQNIHLNMGILVNIASRIEKVEANLGQMDISLKGSKHVAHLTRLPYGIGTTWNHHQMCYPGTRRSILEEVGHWITDFDAEGTKKIFCLTGAPGAGKSAIAHSVAKNCAENGWLATAFFFNREDSTRASLLFSTIICDLAARFPGFQASISQAIENDPSLASAGPCRQFNGLILPFASRLPHGAPIVIVLDALDEGCTEELINVFRKDICNLPKNILLFMTTREIEGVKLLLNASHVHHKRFYHNQELDDGKLVAQERLKKIAEIKDLSQWPTDNVIQDMVTRSQGLMIWIVTVCQYLQDVPDPERDLQTILERRQLDDQGVEENMDDLYALILLGFKWKNKAFAEGYKQVMGTILASIVPLSADAIKSLLWNDRDLPVHNIIQILKPLLLPSEEGMPVQVLHLSLHDFLTNRVHTSGKDVWKPFFIDEPLQSQKLGLLCIQLLNKNLLNAMPGTGYLFSKDKEIPKVLDGTISEQLQYACRFWMDHILATGDPSQEVNDALEAFLKTHFVLWLEITTCIGPIVDIGPFLTWIDNTSPHFKDLLLSQHIGDAWISLSDKLSNTGRRNEALIAAELGCKIQPKGSAGDEGSKTRHASAFLALSIAQSGMGLRNDALQSARESNMLYRQLAEQNPNELSSGLAMSLHNLGNKLSEMGLNNEALQTTREAVDIRKKLVEMNPTAFNPDFARSLQNLGNMLLGMGQREEALKVTQDAVVLFKILAEQNPDKFNSDLARTLNNLGTMLSDMGQREEALQATRQAVKMRRKLAEQNSTVFTADLARSLQNLGNMLSDMGLREEALQEAREAVAIFRMLAEKHSAAFNVELATSLHNLGSKLSDMGLREEALHTATEAVGLWREAAEQSPAAYNVELARSLHNLGFMLSDMGLREEALHATREAVDIRKILAEKNPAAFSPDYAKSLQNLGNMLSDMGFKEEALQVSQDATHKFKMLAGDNPAAFESDLAGSLHNLGKMLSIMGLREEALQATREAVELRKNLAEQNSTAYNHFLARSLNNLSNMLSGLGLKEEAVQASKNATDMFTILAEQNPVAFNPDLAISLSNLGKKLADIGLRDEALHAVREAVGVQRKLTEQNPSAFKSDLAISLHSLGVMLSAKDSREEALHAMKEAVDIRKNLAKHNSAAFNPDLARSLHNLSIFLKLTDQNNDALAAIKDAIRIWEMLAIQHPEVATFESDLADSIRLKSILEGNV